MPMKAEPVTTNGDAAKHAQKLASLAAYRRLKDLVAQWRREEVLKKKIALATLVGLGLILMALVLFEGARVVVSLMEPTGAVIADTDIVAIYEGIQVNGSRKRTVLVTLPEPVATYRQRFIREVQSRANTTLVPHTRSLSGPLSTQVNVFISTNGAVYNVMLRRSSGNDELDHAALTLVKRGEQFEPLPSGLQGEMLGFTIALKFHPPGSETASNSGKQQTPKSGAADPKR